MNPRCTIVVPVHDRAGLTRQCLEAILADPPRTSFEIVVVDDASTDRTAQMLASLGDAVIVVSRGENGGFATACNDGAAAAHGDPYLLFLNNDTIPTPGWLDALVAYADERPQVAVVGAKLLFPDGSVQHAGVTICQDGRPRHLYAGFPADHSAVSKSRRFQAVTAACALFRRHTFEQAGGFDPAYFNSLEDADLCLRLGDSGHEVHLCHEAVVYHLESVSRARSGEQAVRNDKIFQERWGERTRRDDLDYYLADGLLRFRYRDSYPIGLEVSPLLAAVGDVERRPELERMLDSQARHVAELLRETVRLSARLADVETGNGEREGGGAPPSSRAEFLRQVEEIEIQIHGLQTALASGLGTDGEAPLLKPSEQLGYRRLVTEIRHAAADSLPSEANVIVISRGDDELLDLDGRRASHFPQDDDGTYAGYHPADGGVAVEHLEALRDRGAEFLLVPSTGFWWLERYPELAEHLQSHSTLVSDGETCKIYRLDT
jgi:GT2 family glycosyltransferase